MEYKRVEALPSAIKDRIPGRFYHLVEEYLWHDEVTPIGERWIDGVCDHYNEPRPPKLDGRGSTHNYKRNLQALAQNNSNTYATKTRTPTPSVHV